MVSAATDETTVARLGLVGGPGSRLEFVDGTWRRDVRTDCGVLASGLVRAVH